MDVGAVLNEAWELYRRFLGRFVLIAAIVYVVVGLVSSISSLAADEGTLAALVWFLINLVVSIVGVFWLQGTLVEAIRDVRDGRAEVPVGELFSRVRPRLPALIVAGILAGLGITIGLALLIVPGLFLLTRWLLIVPVIVLEDRSAGESFGRSWEIVKGRSWNVFGLIVATFILILVASFVLGLVVGAVLAFLPDFLATWIASVVVGSLIAPFVALAWTLAYYHLTRPGEARLQAA